VTEPHNNRSEAHGSVTNPSQVRDDILDYLEERPGATVREVGEAVGLRSSSSAFYQLGILEENGQIKREICPTCSAKIWTINGGGDE
jgi:predicted transcriptional regulator